MSLVGEHSPEDIEALQAKPDTAAVSGLAAFTLIGMLC